MKQYVSVPEVMKVIRENVKGTSTVTVDLDSPMDGKMRKTNNPFDGKGIVKRETLNGLIGYDYANSVNRLAAKEGMEEREAKRHPWGDMDEERLFRIHRTNGKPYLSMKVQGVVVHGFFAPDGTEIDAAAIRAFIPEKKKSSTQSDLEGEIIARDYGMENITAIRAFKNEYIIGAIGVDAEKTKVAAEEQKEEVPF